MYWLLDQFQFCQEHLLMEKGWEATQKQPLVPSKALEVLLLCLQLVLRLLALLLLHLAPVSGEVEVEPLRQLRALLVP